MEHQDTKASVGQTVLINAEYSVHVDLKFYTLTLHFAPSAENSNF